MDESIIKEIKWKILTEVAENSKRMVVAPGVFSNFGSAICRNRIISRIKIEKHNKTISCCPTYNEELRLAENELLHLGYMIKFSHCRNKTIFLLTTKGIKKYFDGTAKFIEDVIGIDMYQQNEKKTYEKIMDK